MAINSPLPFYTKGGYFLMDTYAAIPKLGKAEETVWPVACLEKTSIAAMLLTHALQTWNIPWKAGDAD